MRRQAKPKSPLAGAVLNVIAFAWIGRGMWRVSRGRAPWQGR
jgi:hypothetical protein